LRASIKEGKTSDGDRFSRGFMEFFVALIGNHAPYLQIDANNKVSFEKERYISSKPKCAVFFGGFSEVVFCSPSLCA
jgi:hypothetical protein